MFERYTERARQVIVLAQEEARKLKHGYIGTEHLLLGICREEEGLGARVLASLDVDDRNVRKKLKSTIGMGDHTGEGQIPFTPRAKKVLDLGFREALSLGHNYIGTEHILLGLVRENEGVAARILLDFDADSEKIRNEVIRALQGKPAHTKESDEVERDYRITIQISGEVRESNVQARSRQRALAKIMRWKWISEWIDDAIGSGAQVPIIVGVEESDG